MGFFGDFFQDIGDAVLGPVRILEDVITGQDPTDSFQRFTGGVLGTVLGPFDDLADNSKQFRDFLQDDMLNDVLLGIPGNVGDQFAFVQKLSKEQVHDERLFKRSIEGVGKIAAVALTAGAVAGAGAGGSAAGAGAGAASGKVAGGIAGESLLSAGAASNTFGLGVAETLGGKAVTLGAVEGFGAGVGLGIEGGIGSGLATASVGLAEVSTVGALGLDTSLAAASDFSFGAFAKSVGSGINDFVLKPIAALSGVGNLFKQTGQEAKAIGDIFFDGGSNAQPGRPTLIDVGPNTPLIIDGSGPTVGALAGDEPFDFSGAPVIVAASVAALGVGYFAYIRFVK